MESTQNEQTDKMNKQEKLNEFTNHLNIELSNISQQILNDEVLFDFLNDLDGYDLGDNWVHCPNTNPEDEEYDDHCLIFYKGKICCNACDYTVLEKGEFKITMSIQIEKINKDQEN